ncbi:MAG: dynamin family protein [Anaerolineaceae bacterium]|nr:dynamin family protein [Anaerolineaceae bacterium]
MAVENLGTKLATEYEAIRRREYELITRLLDVLPKVDTLDPTRLGQVRDALFHADHPYLMVFVGPFSSGKSSIINALLGQDDLLPIGPVPTTDRISILRWGEEPQRMSSAGEADTVFHPSPLLKKVSFVDTPGLESVFQKHEETTRKFLHRADVVLMVMLATQAMTARNLEYMQTLKEYGKKVIIMINQVDLLSAEEAESVKEYVLDQSQSRLGFRPDVWLVSARQGLAARHGDELDKIAWKQSGLSRIEEYVDDQLNDVARLRQKLQTPLQITQNVVQVGLNAIRTNQEALDHYQSIAGNLDQQLAAQRRDLEKTVREVNEEISGKFGEAAMRGSEAIGDIFRFGRALGWAIRGFFELIGLARLLRRGRDQAYVHNSFSQHKTDEPVLELPTVADKLGPRLEGKDIQDIDDLVKYAKREINALPEAIQGKVIGTLQAPIQYDRAALQSARRDLETIENEAKIVETDRLEQTLRNTLLYLSVYEILLIVFGVFLLAGGGSLISPDRPEVPLILIGGLLILALLGLAFMPLRGRLMESAYTNRMLKLQSQYIEMLGKAADKQIEYGMRLRGEAVQPLTRLIDAQTQLQSEQLAALQSAEREMVSIESALTALGGKKLI